MTNLDDVIDFGYIIMNRCASSTKITSFLTDGVTSGIEADDLVDKYIFGYDYVDDVTEGSETYICIDTNVAVVRGTTMVLDIDIDVISHKSHMKLDPVKFPAVKGYRRDNIMREIDALLRDGSLFGIGKLNLLDTNPLNVPNRFTGKSLHYQSVTFSNRLELLVT